MALARQQKETPTMNQVHALTPAVSKPNSYRNLRHLLVSSRWRTPRVWPSRFAYRRKSPGLKELLAGVGRDRSA